MAKKSTAAVPAVLMFVCSHCRKPSTPPQFEESLCGILRDGKMHGTYSRVNVVVSHDELMWLAYPSNLSHCCEYEVVKETTI